MAERGKLPLSFLFIWLLVLFFIGRNSPALATEMAFGRYIPGLFAGPASGVVPPAPGVYWQNAFFYYQVSAGKNLQVPLGAL
ncbi:hypothetical protein C4J81_15195 [Deltaproteobacteria bacterium Smac51]|nr:hypothetical protein C4J81_15195 [Deltaproteobacteria bacterium Smac51]